jgi:hypothetical protein
MLSITDTLTARVVLVWVEVAFAALVARDCAKDLTLLDFELAVALADMLGEPFAIAVALEL